MSGRSMNLENEPTYLAGFMKGVHFGNCDSPWMTAVELACHSNASLADVVIREDETLKGIPEDFEVAMFQMAIRTAALTGKLGIVRYLNAFADVYQGFMGSKDYQRALMVALEALAVHELMFGWRTEDASQCYFRLSETFYALNQTKNAEWCLEQASNAMTACVEAGGCKRVPHIPETVPGPVWDDVDTVC